ncbi:MAG: polyamine aminopropyltransferase [Sulfolobales archaeon]
MFLQGSWYLQKVSDNTYMLMKIRSIIYRGRTKYQYVEIVDFEDYGVGLVLDGFVQSTEADEYIYHESLVHPAMTLHRGPEDVLVIGGGEGATIREVLKHNTVKRCVMVDIDGELVELAKKYLGVMHKGSFYDPRVQLVIKDGLEYVRESKDKSFDVVILDLTDPYEPSGLARELYSEKFYRDIKRVLREDGVVISQVGNAFYYPREFDQAVSDMKRVFRYVITYEVWIPSFGYSVNYVLATDIIDPLKINSSEINDVLRHRGVTTRFFNGEIYESFINRKVIKKI